MRVLDVLEDKRHFYVVSELLCEELSKRVQRRGNFSERDAAVVFQQILMALNYLHLKNIVHRDIKLENVLMKTNRVDDLTLKVTDFGFARMYDPDIGLNEVLGSPLYMAPELITNLRYGTSVDIWSAGVMFYILLVGEPPFLASSKAELFSQITTKEV